MRIKNKPKPGESRSVQETVCREWIFFAILDEGEVFSLDKLSHRCPLKGDAPGVALRAG